ncbi:MAG: imidazole glycerol phosphate synthase subunit HisF [Chitinophagaceae bacterium]|nr:imidazole glycerol phosphate synthase subunit HisF [Chitinophagaceae bacterium]
MIYKRVIPCLLLDEDSLVKTKNFAKPNYIGDPMNAVRIFNDKEVDELIILDINCTRNRREPNYGLLKDIVSEAFMPIAYGGGIRNLEQIKKIVNLGIEKIILNNHVLKDVKLIQDAADFLGSSSVVVAIDIKKSMFGGYKIYDHVTRKTSSKNVFDHINEVIEKGAGELFINSVDNDGIMSGYDLHFLEQVLKITNVPVIVSGGAGNYEDLAKALSAGASGAAAGSIFVYVGKHNAVMINYPEFNVLKNLKKDYGLQ